MKILSGMWDRYWFRPMPLIYLGIARIVMAGYLCAHLLIFDFLGRLRAFSSLPDELYDPLPIVNLILLPFGWGYRPGFEFLQIAFWLTIGAGFLAVIGLFTRFSLAAVTTGAFLIFGYTFSFNAMHHDQAALMIGLTLLIVAPAGRILSVDDLIRRSRKAGRSAVWRSFALKSKFAAWPFLTMHWILALIYLNAGLFKLKHFDHSWMNGHTLQYYFFKNGIERDIPLGIWMGQFHEPAVWMSWLTVGFELGFCLMLIWPLLSMAFIPVGILFHIGIFLMMKANFLPYIAVYVVFLPWIADAVMKILNRKKARTENRQLPERLTGLLKNRELQSHGIG